MTAKSSALMKAPTDRSPEEAVRAYCKALFSGGAAALSTLLNRTLTVDLDPTLLEGFEAVGERLPRPWVVAEVRFTRGLRGTHVLIIPRADAAALAQLALGQEPSESPGLSLDHETALRDMINQMMSSACASLKGLLDRPVAFATTDLTFIEHGDSWTPPAHWAGVARVSVEGTRLATLALTIPDIVAEELSARSEPAQRGEAEGVPAGGQASGLDLILDITLPITVELGRTKMLIRDVLALSAGSVIELDKLAGEPVEILVNDRPIARGEVVIIDENFGVRLTHISRPADRIRSLR